MSKSSTALSFFLASSLIFLQGEYSQALGSADAVGVRFLVSAIIALLISKHVDKLLCALPHLLGGGGSKRHAGASWRNRIANALAKRPIAFPMATIILCNIPLIIAFYPGIVAWDCEYELEMALGYIQTSTHHPPLHMFLLGALWDACGENGLFLLVIVQFALYSYAVARTAETARKLGLKNEIVFTFVIFSAVFPFPVSREFSLYKDALFLPFIMLLACSMTEQAFGFSESKRCRIETSIRVVVFSLFVVVLRNDGIYIVVALMMIAVIMSKKMRPTAIAAAASCAALSLCLATFAWPALGIASGSKGEALSLPIQQLAQVFSAHDDADQSGSFSDVNAAIDIKTAAQVYNPHFADPAKGCWRNAENVTGAFIKGWAQYGVEYPSDFTSATWSMWSGYLAPWFSNLNGHEEDTFQLTHRSDYDETAAVKVTSPEWSEPLRSLYTLYCKAWIKAPVFSTIAGPGIYTWILAISLFCLIRNRGKGFGKNLLVLAPAVLVLGVCLLSPVAACMRYYLPVAMMTPLALGSVANMSRQSLPSNSLAA